MLALVVILLVATLSYREKFNKTLAGYQLYVVESDSMGKSLPKGAIAIAMAPGEQDSKRSQSGNLDSPISVGDIIAFEYPLDLRRTISHRVIEIKTDDGLYYETKGDANSTSDPWQVRDEIIKGKILFHIPLIGYLVIFIRKPAGLIFFVIVPVILMILQEVEDVYKGFVNKQKSRRKSSAFSV